MVQQLVNSHLQDILLVILDSYNMNHIHFDLMHNTNKSVVTSETSPDVRSGIRLFVGTEGLLNELIPFSTKDKKAEIA